MAKAD
jgi:hypothetical protein